MATRTIKVTGLPDELLQLLDAQVRGRHAMGRSQYIRNLIRKDVLVNGPSFDEILAPVHAETARLGITEGDLDALIDQARAAAYQERSSRRSH